MGVLINGEYNSTSRQIEPKNEEAKTNDKKFKNLSFEDNFISLYERDFLS